MSVHAEYAGSRIKSARGLFRAWRRCAERAADKQAIPVVAVFGPSWPGTLLVVKQADLTGLTRKIAELEAALA